jgi:hypothetical protein
MNYPALTFSLLFCIQKCTCERGKRGPRGNRGRTGARGKNGKQGAIGPAVSLVNFSGGNFHGNLFHIKLLSYVYFKKGFLGRRA